MLLAFPLILTQAQCLDSTNPSPVGEQIFVKSCQSALLFLTQRFRGETLRGLGRFLVCYMNSGARLVRFAWGGELLLLPVQRPMDGLCQDGLADRLRDIFQDADALGLFRACYLTESCAEDDRHSRPDFHHFVCQLHAG